ncbi:LysR substrate-binding domain-containing protein [Sphingomonas tabacisoli]|uniref:LysR substrate-binding domain-containing protein n=1 Tax=Sphingomonas tabacisoli TaxID=2249466 RepID=A0ABW4I6N6_9SPHN
MIGSHLDGIEDGLSALSALREKPAGTVRITATEHAARSVLWPAFEKLLPHYPEINLEIIISYGLTDIVAEQIDAGVRPGGIIDKNMIAVPIAQEMRMAVVGSPSYFADRDLPLVPQDLTGHSCINLRLPRHGGVYVWEFEKGSRELNVRVSGQLTFNLTSMILEAAIGGFGLAMLPEDQVINHLSKGRLVRVLKDWCEPYPGYHLYYPSRRQPTPAFSVLVNELRYRGET